MSALASPTLPATSPEPGITPLTAFSGRPATNRQIAVMTFILVVACIVVRLGISAAVDQASAAVQTVRAGHTQSASSGPSNSKATTSKSTPKSGHVAAVPAPAPIAVVSASTAGPSGINWSSLVNRSLLIGIGFVIVMGLVRRVEHNYSVRRMRTSPRW